MALLALMGAAEPDLRAQQLAGLFMQGCLPFAGDAKGLRAWAEQQRLPVLPPPAQRAFLLGAPGAAYDASNATGKYVLASSDDGLCSAVADSAMDAAVGEALDSGLRRMGLAFRLVIDRADTRADNVHYREYLAARNGRGWRILVATVRGAAGRAMLTAGPE